MIWKGNEGGCLLPSIVSTPPLVADFIAPIKRRPCCFFLGGSGVVVGFAWIAEASSWSGTPVGISKFFCAFLRECIRGLDERGTYQDDRDPHQQFHVQHLGVQDPSMEVEGEAPYCAPQFLIA